MGIYIYTVMDRKTGKILYSGKERDAAEYVGCSREYMRQLASHGTQPIKRTAFGHLVVSREWEEIKVFCADCGQEIPNAAPTRERCDVCRERRLRQQAEQHRKKAKEQKGVNRAVYPMSQAELQRPCIGCLYFGGENNINKPCNYIFIEGHRRGCQPGAGCTKKKLKDKG